MPAPVLYQIKHRYTGAVLFTTEATTLKGAVEAAVAAGVSLAGANLYGANLYRANLYRANLNGANLNGVNLNGVSLAGANLYGANLYGASLAGVSLAGANLYGANLAGANLENTTLPGFQIPQEGGLVVWKKLRNQVLAKLLIPADAARTASLVGRKCRAAFADVLLLVDAAGNEVAKERSIHDATFWYVAGERVTPAAYNDDVREECQAGIHFFLTKEEAQNYN